jgi:UDP-N-acetylmuramate dehydrogenase
VNTTALQELAARVRGEVRFDEPLAEYTTYRIGGPAAALVQTVDTEDVAAALGVARETGLRWLALGLGSNVLIADQGFDGIVLRLGQGLDRIAQKIGGDPTVWSVGAGLPTPRLARRTAKAGLAGMQRLVGVPGTVGGGVFMNAGAHGQDFSQVVRTVDVVRADGSVGVLHGSEIAWRYRRSGLDNAVVVGTTVELQPADPRQLEREIRQHLRWRKAGTPFNEPCCGSVFRNPSGTGAPRSAGQLIDSLGLKGFRVGGAEVSTVHANYIVNTGYATASDVVAIIAVVREKVMKEYGVELELEVEIIGEL